MRLDPFYIIVGIICTLMMGGLALAIGKSYWQVNIFFIPAAGAALVFLWREALLP